MKSPNFFIDTADCHTIEYIWSKLADKCHPSWVAGITTNPNAMSKVNASNMIEFEVITRKLCKIVTTIRGDSSGIVYVQHPDSSVSFDELKNWYSVVKQFSDGHTSVGLKIPPSIHLLQRISELGEAHINVTGLADCSTALLCLGYPVRYVSIIPGRMEENGINADEHLLFLSKRNTSVRVQEVITGSMRTLDGLRRAIEHDTVPTIGTKVFDLIFSDGVDNFINYWKYFSNNDNSSISLSPEVNKCMANLSIAFFNQMDEAGKILKGTLNG